MNDFSMNLPDAMTAMTGHHLGLGVYNQRSKGFQALINGIGAAKTKHEEDKIIRKELLSLKEYVSSSKLSAKQIRELLIRLIYCEMLGHDASFGYINAIKYAEQSKLLEKKTGYLAASVFLNKNHTLVCLLINTIQKDLASTNVVAKSTVLSVICNLVDAEKIPPLLPFIVTALKDKRVEIRKKALITLRHVHQLSEDLIVNIDEQLRSAISDRDPIVVSGALQFFHPLIKKNPSKYRSYLKVFLQVLTQVVEGKLTEYNFHGVQAPWIQIKLLNILALLGHQNRSCSESMSTTLINMMRALPTDCNIGCAVMFECIRTATTIYPLKPLLDLAAKKTTLFLTSNLSNLKCLGITAMTSLVEVNTSYAGDEKLQQVIIKCLDDDDKTIGKKILELLYKITNSENVCVICEKLLGYIRSTTEQTIKCDVARNLAQLANQYAPNITWYVDTINDVIQAADSFVQPDVVHSLIKVIAAGESDDQRIIATGYLELVKKTTLNDSLVQIACWGLGEYGNLLQDSNSLEMVFLQLTALLDRKFEDTTTYGWIMSALAKLTRLMGVYSPEANRIMDRYRTGFPAELRQRCHEINSLATDMSLMKNVLPLASAGGDIKVCSSLSFLDNYVANALTAGARPYQPHLSNVEEATEPKKAPQELRFQPYDDPFSSKSLSGRESFEYLKDDDSSFAKPSPQNPVSPDAEESVKSAKESASKATPRTVWGPSGYTGNKIKKAAELGPEKTVQTSSGHSSSEDRVSQNQECGAETTRSLQEVKSSERSLPLVTSVDKSSNVALFAGIKPKTKVDTSRKVKTDTYDETKTKGAAFSSLEESPEPSETTSLLEENSQILDDKNAVGAMLDVGFEVTETGDFVKHDSLKKTALNKEENNQIHTDNNAVGSLLDADIGINETSSLLKQDSSNKSASLVEENKQIHLDRNDVGSILDADIEISGSDDFVKQDTSTLSSDSLSQKDQGKKELCIDSNVRLIMCVVARPTELVMVMKLTNHNQGRFAIERISLKIEPPSNLIADASRAEITVGNLSFLETVTKEISLKCQYPATRMTLKGALRYTVSQNSKVLHFKQELPARHLFRPLAMSTEQFGEKWTSTSCDLRKHVTMTSRRSCEDVVGVITKYIQFQTIDIKGSEGIAAASVLGNDTCLLHFNVLNADIEMWVKSSSKKLSEMIVKECLNACDELNKS